MKKVLLPILIILISSLAVNAQHGTCGFDQAHIQALSDNPELINTIQINEGEIQKIVEKRKKSRRAESVYTIPVVFHVIHTGEAVGVGNNISDAQINSGITQMNNAYSNAHGQSIDTKIQFQLASSDPNCNATTGIIRVDGSVLTDYATMGVERQTSNGATDTEVKALSRWSSSDYYNIWVITEIDNSNNTGVHIVGYAQLPGGTASSDGTLIVNPAVGNVGTAVGGESETLIHELGHALGLYHTFAGDRDSVQNAVCPVGNQCGYRTAGNGEVISIGDCLSDTPPHIRSPYDCNTAGTNSCDGGSSNSLFANNYMDYSSDACTHLFTSGQKGRMRATMESTRASLLSGRGFRSPLANYILTAATCTGVMNQKFNNIGVTNVQIVGKLDVTSGSASVDNGYLDKTTSCENLVELYPDTTYTFQTTIVSTSYDQKVRAWIDYNDDGSFGAGEEIYYNAAIPMGTPTASANFTVPTGATTSKYLRMRVMVDHTSVTITGACDPLEYGETEDYIIYMKSAATPAPVADFSGSSTAICAGESVTFNDASTNTPTSWAWVTTGGNPSSSTNQNQSVVYNTAGTYTVTLTATNASGSDSEVKTNYITVSAASVGGTISADATVCSGSNGATLTVASHTGSVVRWESSTDNFTTTTTIANTSTTQAYSNLTTTTKYRAVIKSGTCAEANSTASTITVDPASVGGTVTAAATVCTGANGATLTVAGHTGSVVRWESSEDNFTTTTTIANTTITQAYLNLTATTKYRAVVQSGTCSSSNSTTAIITVSPSLAVSLGADVSACVGTNLALDAGNTGATYLWSTAETTQSITPSTSATYDVIVTSASGCIGKDTIVVTINALPVVSVNSHTVCSGDAASIFTATSATAASYLWSGNGSGNGSTASGTTVGSYTVQVTDGNGCVASGTGTLTVNAVPTVNLGADQSACTAVTLDAGNSGVSFLWNNSATTQTLAVSAGTHDVIVTDLNGCIGKDTVVISIGTAPTVNLGADKSFCAGDNVTIDAGNTGSTYVWNQGSTNQTVYITSTVSATTFTAIYDVIVTDASGCVGKDTVSVTVNSLPSVSVNNTAICTGDVAATFTATSATAASYLWSGNGSGNGSTASGTTAGSYTVQVTDGNGCIASGTGTLTVNAVPTVNLGADQSACTAVTLDAGNSGVSFLWNNSATTQTLAVSAGTHDVIVTDLNGCIGKDTVVISIGTAPTVNLGADVSACVGTNLTLDAGNTGATYLWSTAETTQSITPSTSATYDVIVTSASGCIGKDTIVVTINALPVVSVNSHTVCNGDAASTFTATSATAATYLWSANGSGNGSTASGTTAGNYTVQVTDGNGCTTSGTGTLTVNAVPTVNLGADQSSCTAVTLDAGNTGVSFLWNNSATTQTLAVSAGTHDVIVTDLNGCIGKDTVVISIGTAPTVSLGPDVVFCDGNSTNLNANNAGSTYLWSTGATTQSINVSSAGSYHVTVTNTGCIEKDTITITVNALPIVNLGTEKTICAGDSVTLDAGNPGATYQWMVGSSETTQTIKAKNTDSYHVLVTDINGCTKWDTVNVIVNALPAVSVANTSICTGGGATMVATSATAISYLWSGGGSGTNANIAAFTAGNYTVQVTDVNGCQANATGVLTVNTSPTVTVDPDFPVNYDITQGNVSLTFGLPTGGSYSGTGMFLGVFNTATAGNGSHVITYNYTDPATGCSGTTTNTLMVSTATAVGRVHAASNISVSPNPFNNQLRVSFLTGSTSSTYSVLDASGKLTLSGTIEITDGKATTVINTAVLTPGVYYLVVKHNEAVSTVKVVKSK